MNSKHYHHNKKDEIYEKELWLGLSFVFIIQYTQEKTVISFSFNDH